MKQYWYQAWYVLFQQPCSLLTYISLFKAYKVYKKLSIGIIGLFLGSFTNFMIRQLSFSITKSSKNNKIMRFPS